MPKRTSIGVDIGSSAVRAAEVVIDGQRSELQRFAQVGLPAGAVVEGEVRDQAAVSAALKRLWAEGGFRRRDVVLGVSSQRAMVRLIEMPAIAPKELRSALRYEIGDLLPIPLDQAVFDYSVLGPGRPGGDGGATTQVLVVVAQKDIVWDEIAVAKRAGLRVRAVDASPLALLRAVPPPAGSEGLDAVVSLGAQLVVVAVRQGMTPRFMRTATVASEVEAARASTGSRLVPAQGRVGTDPRATGPKADPVVEEVRSSIEFFLSHAQGAQLDHVQLTGGGALAPGLAARLGAALNMPVVPAGLAATCERSALGLDEEQFRDASQRWTTAVGLARWGSEGTHAPSLLPAEIEKKKRERATIVMAAASVVVVAGALGVVSHGRVDSIASVNRQTTSDQLQAALLQAQEKKLNVFPQIMGQVQARRGLAADALSNDIDWVKLDQRIEKALPAGVRITSITFTGTPTEVGAPAPAAGAAGTVPYVGTLSITGQAAGGLPAVALFVKDLNATRGVGAVWVASSQVATANGAQQAAAGASGLRANGLPVAVVAPGPAAITFSATAEVTHDALSHRASQLPGGN